jgi:hypothetical protein
VFTNRERWSHEVEVTNKSRKVRAPSNSNSTNDEDNFKKARHGTAQTASFSSSLDSFSGHPNVELVEGLFEMAQSILTGKQRSLLLSAFLELRWNSMTLTRLCERLSRELGMSYSTVKWNIKRLAIMRLISGGTESTKGTKAQLTALGHLIAFTLSQGSNSCRSRASEATTT